MDLRPHNKKAYDNLKNMYENGVKKAAIVHPTGTGKSYITMQLIQDNPNKKIVIVSPTNAILDQYRKRLEYNDIDYSNVEFVTYSKIMNMKKEGKLGGVSADNIILDEFHHCGAKEWGQGVKELLLENEEANVLGLSATPIRYLDKLRDMSEEVFSGNIASEMNLAEAILDGLLEVPIYHQGIYSIREEEEKRRERIESSTDEELKEELKKELEKIKEASAKIDATKQVLEKGISEDRRNGKYIIFCRDIKDMHKAMKKAGDWFENINEVEMYNMATKDIHGKIIERLENEKELELFEKSESEKIKLMFAINMLNEGIHVDGIDGIIMLRGTKSPIVYRQEMGRVLSIGGKENPVVFDFADNIDCTRYVYELYQEMQEIINERKRRGKNTKKEEEVLKKFEIDDYIKEIRELIEELDDNTYNKIWDRNFNILKEYIKTDKKAKEYFEETGGIKQTTVIKVKNQKVKIGHWLNGQKQGIMKKYQGMTIEEINQDETISKVEKNRMRQLLELGVRYSNGDDWQEKFNALKHYLSSNKEAKEYFGETGGIKQTTVIKVKDQKVKIGHWLNGQKQGIMKKYQGMTIEEINQDEAISKVEKNRMRQLLELGVEYVKINEKTDEEIWQEKFDALKYYLNSNEEAKRYIETKNKIKKNTVIEINGEEVKIDNWLDNQRRRIMKKYQGMTIEEIKQDKTIPEEDKNKMIQLLELGVHYQKDKDEKWNENFEALGDYIDSSNKTKKYFEKTGTIKDNVVIETKKRRKNKC